MENKIGVCSFCPLYGVISRFSKSEARKHLLNARKEILLAARSLIEKEIDRTEKAKGGEKAKKVEVS